MSDSPLEAVRQFMCGEISAEERDRRLADSSSSTPKNEETEEKPCPFCGSQLIEPIDDGHVHWLACMDCDAEGPAKYTEAEAIAAWNRRAS